MTKKTILMGSIANNKVELRTVDSDGRLHTSIQSLRDWVDSVRTNVEARRAHLRNKRGQS